MAVPAGSMAEAIGYEAINVDNGVKVGLSDNAVVGIVGTMANIASQSIAQSEITRDIVANTQATTNNILTTNESIFSLNAIKRNWVIWVGVGIICVALIVRMTKKRR